MLKYSHLEEYISRKLDLPPEMRKGLLSLLGVDSVADIDPAKRRVLRDDIFACLQKSGTKEGYAGLTKAYALYYLTVNIFKIWRPLYDLLIRDQISAAVDILELGCGPGTSTFGIIYFYKILAEESPDVRFDLRFSLVEQHSEFLEIFEYLFAQIMKSLPGNLRVTWKKHIGDVRKELTCLPGKFDFVVESNILNKNEHITQADLSGIASELKRLLNVHGSLILIEPLDTTDENYMRIIRSILLMSGMTCYSPCQCADNSCGQYAYGQIDLRDISLYREMYSAGIVRTLKDTHYFDYAVFRVDGLTKYCFTNTGIPLSGLSDHIGERVRLSGYVLSCAESNETLSIRICDGSLTGKDEVRVEVPKKIMLQESIHCLIQGRGGYLRIKRAAVRTSHLIQADFSTIVEIER